MLSQALEKKDWKGRYKHESKPKVWLLNFQVYGNGHKIERHEGVGEHTSLSKMLQLNHKHFITYNWENQTFLLFFVIYWQSRPFRFYPSFLEIDKSKQLGAFEVNVT